MDEENAPKEESKPSSNKGQRSRRVLSVRELTARERALSDAAEQRKRKLRGEQQAGWREELAQNRFQTMAGVFVEMRRNLDRLRIQGDLTAKNQEQAMRIDHWVTEFQENFRLWDHMRANLEKLSVSLGVKSVDQAIETLREIRPEGVPTVEQTREKQDLIALELQRIGTQILDEKHHVDEEVQSNLAEDRTLQDDIRKMVRHMARKAGHEALEDLRVTTRLPLEERLVQLKILHSKLQKTLAGQFS